MSGSADTRLPPSRTPRGGGDFDTEHSDGGWQSYTSDDESPSVQHAGRAGAAAARASSTPVTVIKVVLACKVSNNCMMTGVHGGSGPVFNNMVAAGFNVHTLAA